MTRRPALLLITDDTTIRDQMKWAFTSDYELFEVSDRTAALLHVRQATPPVVVLDLRLPSTDVSTTEPLAFLQESLRLNPNAKVIVILDNSDQATVIAAFESGAYDVLELPVQLDVLKVVLQRATYLFNL